LEVGVFGLISRKKNIKTQKEYYFYHCVSLDNMPHGGGGGHHGGGWGIGGGHHHSHYYASYGVIGTGNITLDDFSLIQSIADKSESLDQSLADIYENNRSLELSTRKMLSELDALGVTTEEIRNRSVKLATSSDMKQMTKSLPRYAPIFGDRFRRFYWLESDRDINEFGIFIPSDIMDELRTHDPNQMLFSRPDSHRVLRLFLAAENAIEKFEPTVLKKETCCGLCKCLFIVMCTLLIILTVVPFLFYGQTPRQILCDYQNFDDYYYYDDDYYF